MVWPSAVCCWEPPCGSGTSVRSNREQTQPADHDLPRRQVAAGRLDHFPFPTAPPATGRGLVFYALRARRIQTREGADGASSRTCPPHLDPRPDGLWFGGGHQNQRRI